MFRLSIYLAHLHEWAGKNAWPVRTFFGLLIRGWHSERNMNLSET